MQITRIVSNPADTTKIYPSKPKSNSIVKLQPNPFKPVPIYYHRTAFIIESNVEYTNCPLSPTTQTITYHTK